MAWQCPKCGKMNPNTTGNCIHCGAWDEGGYINTDKPTKGFLSWRKIFEKCKKGTQNRL